MTHDDAWHDDGVSASGGMMISSASGGGWRAGLLVLLLLRAWRASPAGVSTQRLQAGCAAVLGAAVGGCCCQGGPGRSLDRWAHLLSRMPHQTHEHAGV